MPATLETLTEALDHHRAGRLAEAEALYIAVLSQEPDQPDALHLAGMLASNSGRHQQALTLIARAIRARSDIAPFHNNLGTVLQKLGRHDQACLCFTQALALAPGYAEAHINFGNSLQSLGLFEESLAHYQAALDRRPDSAEAHNNLANLLVAQGQFERAETAFREALRLKPEYAEAWVNLSGALKSLARYEEAARCCFQAIQLAPDMAEAYSNLAAIFSGAERFEETEAAAWQALSKKPGMAEPWTVLSVVNNARRRFVEAESCARRSIELRPDYAEGWNNLGNALQEQGRMEEADACYHTALRIKPGLADAHYNLGNARRRMLRLPEARACYEEAIRLSPRHVKAHWNLSLTLLLAGDLERGWEEFEWRWKSPKTPPRRFPQPPWDGSSLEGRTILLHAEQGLGDTIQFIRYADMVKKAGATVVVECSAKLGPILATAPGVDRVVETGTCLPEFDVHVPLMSLPRLFRTTVPDIPARVPYLTVDAERRRRWEQRLARVHKPRVGLAWKGNPQQSDDRFRSIAWETLAPLTEIAGVAWFSLQYGDRPGASLGGEVIDLAPETEDFRDAGAAIQQLDLVISVDSAMAHLAGALARPVWVLVPFLPDWRWLLDRPATPWYPTMRLFRQPERGDWESVVDLVGKALIQECSKGPGANRYAL